MKPVIKQLRRYAGLFSALLLILCGILLAGGAYARYQKSLSKDLPFEVRDPDSFQILSENGGWTENGVSAEYALSVNNLENKYNSYYTLRVIASLGFRYDMAIFSLKVIDPKGEEVVYTSVERPIYATDEGYEAVGESTEYIFIDAQGEELIWELEGGKFSQHKFVLVVEGATEPGLARIVVSQTKAKEQLSRN